jgi:hypothetical protein
VTTPGNDCTGTRSNTVINQNGGLPWGVITIADPTNQARSLVIPVYGLEYWCEPSAGCTSGCTLNPSNNCTDAWNASCDVTASG